MSPESTGSHGKRTALRLALSLTLLSVWSAAPVASLQPVSAKNGAVEFAKYFNPLQKKTYLNESQDRIIKKRSFKSENLPAIEPAANREIGLFATVTAGEANNDQLIDSLISRPDISGLSVIFPWQQLEPAEDEFNWQPVDHLLDLLAKHNKTMILRVSTCGLDLPGSESDTPKWVFDASVKSMPYAGADGKTHQMPIFWDDNYLANWRNFIKEFGKRYDKNQSIHSIGITGGGIRGGTSVLPAFAPERATATNEGGSPSTKSVARELEDKLKKDYGMSQRQLVEHWKYVADLFPKAFETARLNFDIDPPTPNRSGQDALDQISDYLVYRYGQRIYLTRQDVADGRHGFDQYRILLKLRSDTLTGYQLAPEISAEALKKVAKFALDDGISFAEVPVKLLTSDDQAIREPLKYMAAHVGFEIVSQKASIPAQIRSGDPIKASFTFLNLGAAVPMRPSRNLDKDVASSYRILVELKDASGKQVVLSLHTPPTPTTQWLSGKPVSWEEDLKMPKLAPGDYSASMWLIDSEQKRKLQFLDAVTQEKPTPAFSIPLGKLHVVPEPSALGSSPATTQ